MRLRRHERCPIGNLKITSLSIDLVGLMRLSSLFEAVPKHGSLFRNPPVLSHCMRALYAQRLHCGHEDRQGKFMT